MDRITKSLLDEFSKDSGLTLLSDEKQFEHLAAYLTAGRHVGESFNTEDVVTGSGGDTGIDAIATIVNGSLVSDPELVEELSETNGYLDASFVFVQAERSPGFDAAKIGTFTFGVVDFFADAPKLPRNDAIKAAAEVMTAVLTRASKFKRGNPTCRLYYVTTGTWTNDPALEARRKASIEDLQRLNLFREVEFIPVDASAIQKLYQQAKNAISRDFVFAEKTVIPEIRGISEAYLGLLPASDFLHLIEDDEGELIKSIFYDNVRDWQDSTLLMRRFETPCRPLKCAPGLP